MATTDVASSGSTFDAVAAGTIPDVRPLAAGSRDSKVRRVLAISDGSAVLLSLILAITASGRGSIAHGVIWGIPIILMMIVVFKLYGLYDRDVKRMSHSTVDDIPWVFHAVILGTLLVSLYARVTPLHRFDFRESLLFGVLATCAVMLGRFVARASAAARLEPERALLVGGGTMARVLAGKLAAHPEYRSRVIGVVSPDGARDVSVGELPVLGSFGDLESVAASQHATRVIVSPGEIAQSELEGLLRRCRALALKVSLLPQLSDVLGPAVEIDDVEGVTVLGVNPPWLPRSSRALKRALDLTVAGTFLLVLLPVLAIIAVMIKLESPGPVFFLQVRVGRGGRRFRVFKFRTMVQDAEEQRPTLLAESKDPNWLHLDHDPRVTRVGRFLRMSSLDELPQLWNVLRGEMSVVGPRPLIEAEDRMVHGWARRRLDLTPGITGYWQVLGRTRIPFEEMVKLDYLYVMNWSLWEDIRLMLRTLPVVMARRGAN
jgi:exopolysaccharide biosynthesis polyprenyl glycosylphosphotransferase